VARHDDRLACHPAPRHHLLLHARHVLLRNLRAQVAARDHDGVGRVDDRLEVGHRVARLNFGNHLDAAPGPGREVGFQVVDDVGGLDERHGDEVN
jgi:hypothetical protein